MKSANSFLSVFLNTRIRNWKKLVGPNLAPILLLSLAAFTLYGKALGHNFLVNWDDPAYVTANPDITGFTGENLRRAFTNEYVGNYAPLPIISYMLDYTLWGFNATGFKLTNVTLHTLNTLLYYALLVRITGRRLLSLAAAALFLCHPVQVESVVWISQRKNLMAMFFFLISFLAYLFWKERRHLGYYFLSLAAFSLALLSKSVAVILPLILISYDLCLREREALWRLVRDKLPYLALALACAVAAFYTQGYDGGKTGYLGGTPLLTMLNMLPVFSRYLILLLFPTRLSIIYSTPVRTSLDTETALSALLIVLLVASWVYLYRRNRSLFFWSSLIIIGILPVSNIIPLEILMADRYLYFPMLGFAAFAAHILILKPGDFPRRQTVPLKIVLISALLALSAATWKRIDVWHDSVTLWEDTVIKSQDGFRYGNNNNQIAEAYAEALSCRGYQAEREGRISAARNYYFKALGWDTTSKIALNNLAGIFLRQGKPLSGLPYLIRLTETYPRDDAGFTNLGLLYYLTGDTVRSDENFRKVLSINPGYKRARYLMQEIEGQRLKTADGTLSRADLTLLINGFSQYIPDVK